MPRTISAKRATHSQISFIGLLLIWPYPAIPSSVRTSTRTRLTSVLASCAVHCLCFSGAAIGWALTVVILLKMLPLV